MSSVRIIEHNELMGFLREDIGRLLNNTLKLLGFIEVLREELDGGDLRELLTEERYKRMLLGGLRRDLSFHENALAKFYKELYGVNYDFGRLTSNIRAGITDPVEAAEGITVRVEEDVLKRLETGASGLLETLRSVFHRASGTLSGEFKKLAESKPEPVELESSHTGVKVLEDLIESALAISPNYNQTALKIVTLRRIPFFYAEKAYPEIRERQVMEFLRGKLGWDEFFRPDVHREEIARKFMIMGYGEASLGEAIINLIVETWRFLIDIGERLSVFLPFKIENEPYKYTEKALKAVSKISSMEAPVRFSQSCGEFHSGYRGDYYRRQYFALTYKELWKGYPPRYNCYAFEGEVRGLSIVREVSLPDMLAYMAPQMYLGISSVERKEADTLIFVYYSR